MGVLDPDLDYLRSGEIKLYFTMEWWLEERTAHVRMVIIADFTLKKPCG